MWVRAPSSSLPRSYGRIACGKRPASKSGTLRARAFPGDSRTEALPACSLRLLNGLAFRLRLQEREFFEHDRGESSRRPCAELGVQGLNRWTVKCLDLSRKRGIPTGKTPPARTEVLSARGEESKPVAHPCRGPGGQCTIYRLFQESRPGEPSRVLAGLTDRVASLLLGSTTKYTKYTKSGFPLSE